MIVLAKRDTYGYRAGLEREKAQRRIAAYQKVTRNENLPERVREQARTSIKELRSAINATRQRTKSGRTIKSRTKEGLDTSLEVLRELNSRGNFYIGRSGQSNAVTQSEINKASVGLESQYTRAQVKIFYRATQKAWQKPGIGEHNRNEAILSYYGRTNLAAFVEEVLAQNQVALRAQNALPESLTEEQRAFYEKEQQVDNADAEKGSPTYMANVITFEAAARLINEPERR